MASSLQKMIFIALIFTIVMSTSMSHPEKSETKRPRKEKSETERHRREENSETESGEDEPDTESGDASDSESNPQSDTERYLRDLCSETKKSKQCWKVIKSELTRFTDTDSSSVAGVVIDLAVAKSDEINNQLNQLYQDSGDDKLKEKYLSCSKNYEDANRNLIVAKGNLDTDDFPYISVQVDDAVQELKSCKREFKKDSYDPAHIRNRNKEFGVYVEIVRVATDRFLKDKDGDQKQIIN